MRRPHVLLVRAVLSHAGDEGLDRDYGLVVGVLVYRLFYWGVSDLKIEYTQLNRLTARVTRSPREYMPSLFCLTRAWTRGFVDAMRD